MISKYLIKIQLRDVLLVLFLAVLVGCHSTRFDALKPGERPEADTDIAGIWYKIDKLEEELKLSPQRVTDPELTSYVENLVCRLAGEYCPDIRVYILDIPYFNATMYPNGLMTVWTGLLLRVENEQQLAAVLGHEIGHYVLSHGATRYRQAKNTQSFVMAASLGGGQLGGLAAQLMGIGALSKFSRDNETEADLYGLELMRQNNMNPLEAAKLWMNVIAEQKASKADQPPLFFASHPPPVNRIENIEAKAALWQQQYDPADPEFKKILEQHYSPWLKTEIAKRNFAATDVVLQRLIASSNDPTTLHYYQAEMHRKRGSRESLDEAAAHYELALQDLPEDSLYRKNALKNLARTYERMDNIPKALVSYREYLEQLPDGSTQYQQISNKILTLEQP